LEVTSTEPAGRTASSGSARERPAPGRIGQHALPAALGDDERAVLVKPVRFGLSVPVEVGLHLHHRLELLRERGPGQQEKRKEDAHGKGSARARSWRAACVGAGKTVSCARSRGGFS
jgi:hypothetical protein